MNETVLTRRQCLLAALAAVVAPVGTLMAGLPEAENSLPRREAHFEMEKIYTHFIMSAGRTNSVTWCGHPPGTVTITGFKCRPHKSKKVWDVTVYYEVNA